MSFIKTTERVSYAESRTEPKYPFFTYERARTCTTCGKTYALVVDEKEATKYAKSLVSDWDHDCCPFPDHECFHCKAMNHTCLNDGYQMSGGVWDPERREWVGSKFWWE